VSHDTDDFVVVNWQRTIGGIRQRPIDGRWLVAISDVSKDDWENSPGETLIVDNRSLALVAYCQLAKRTVASRSSESDE
jgi:hypothetical protein